MPRAAASARDGEGLGGERVVRVASDRNSPEFLNSRLAPTGAAPTPKPFGRARGALLRKGTGPMKQPSACILGRCCLVATLGLWGSSACSGSESPAPSGDSDGTVGGTSISSTAQTSATSVTSTSGTATTSAGTTTSATTGAPLTTGGASVSGSTTSAAVNSSSSSASSVTSGGTTNGAGGAASATTDGGATTGSTGGECPDDATFCSGFEEDELPEGAVYKLNGDPATPWTSDFEVDTSVFNTAPSSLRVRPNTEGSGAYKMLAVPTPGAAFWVRFYLRSDVDLGHEDHNVFAAAAGSDNPNDSTYIEFAEDVGIAFNSHDVVRWPDGFGRLEAGGTNPFTLPKDMWHCIEISYDGQARAQQLYVNDALQIDAQGFPEGTNAFTTFKFGYNSLHGTTRNTWYDDVAVAASRIGCF